jgi:hypothetical protein
VTNVILKPVKTRIFQRIWVSNKQSTLERKMPMNSNVTEMSIMVELMWNPIKEQLIRLPTPTLGTLSTTITTAHSIQTARTKSNVEIPFSVTQIPVSGNSASAKSGPEPHRDSVVPKAKPASHALETSSTVPISTTAKEPPSTSCSNPDTQ